MTNEQTSKIKMSFYDPETRLVRLVCLWCGHREDHSEKPFAERPEDRNGRCPECDTRMTIGEWLPESSDKASRVEGGGE